MENLFVSLRVIFEKLYPSYSKKLWKFILDESVHFFIQMLLICSLKFTPDEKQELVAKIKKDKHAMEELFKNIMSSRDVDPSIAKLTSVEDALMGPATEIPVHIVKLKLALQSQWNDNCTVASPHQKCLLRLRKDIPKEEKIAIMKSIENQGQLIKGAQRKELGKLMSKSLMTEFKISRFVANFRARFEKKKKDIELRKNIALKEEILTGPSDSVDSVESCMSVRGNLEFKLRAYESKTVLDRVKSKGETNTLDKFYFCFFDDILAWKQKSNSTKVEGKAFLVSIDELGPERDKFFYFTTKKFIYFFKCENTQERNKWVRAISFLRDHAIIELKPLVFEK